MVLTVRPFEDWYASVRQTIYKGKEGYVRPLDPSFHTHPPIPDRLGIRESSALGTDSLWTPLAVYDRRDNLGMTETENDGLMPGAGVYA